jgi:penicillin-binding protein 1C
MILARMKLGETERRHALKETLKLAPPSRSSIAMHFVEQVQRIAPKNVRRIRTTLDARLQRNIAGILDARRAELRRHGANSVAVAVLDNASGEWLAWEGSGDYFGSSFGGAIDGVRTLRQPGSTLKPFTYAVAFESGHNPASVIADVPSHFPTAEAGVVYSPRNYDGAHRGPMRIREALAGSQNVPAVAMLEKVGPESLLRLLRNSGFDSLDRTADHYGLGLTLGDPEVTLEQLVRAYAMLARGGETIETTMLMGGGRESARRRLLAERTAFWITDILSDADAREYAFGRGGSLELPFPAAVKTGTSQAYRDNWTIGYTRDVTVGVWVGNFDRSELRGSSGVTGAAPIFHAVMLAATALRGEPEAFAPPAGVDRLPVCALSGGRPSPWCPSVTREWLASGEMARFCEWHHDGHIEWPAEYRSWAAKRRPQQSVIQDEPSVVDFAIANPPDGATYLIDPTLRMEFQTLRLRAHSSATVAWSVNGRGVGRATADGDVEWPLQPGRHTIRAVDARGRRSEVTIHVK